MRKPGRPLRCSPAFARSRSKASTGSARKAAAEQPGAALRAGGGTKLSPGPRPPRRNSALALKPQTVSNQVGD
ncbi:hypothetical protein Y1Q_0021770 [Alligator mississippiensis]|uniref:Uncharacterized protein n=1 Tax=Alligator mississippiensis TaxID=8496 RepID=A0A151PB26_ALLMI|nr:hypothetical protein Y1Q_0021770 [Alligator mississippiensis]